MVIRVLIPVSRGLALEGQISQTEVLCSWQLKEASALRLKHFFVMLLSYAYIPTWTFIPCCWEPLIPDVKQPRRCLSRTKRMKG